MLMSIKSLRGETIHAIDGDFGSVDDFLFDDENLGYSLSRHRYQQVATGPEGVDFARFIKGKANGK